MSNHAVRLFKAWDIFKIFWMAVTSNFAWSYKTKPFLSDQTTFSHLIPWSIPNVQPINLISAKCSPISRARTAIGHQTRAATTRANPRWSTCTCRLADQWRLTWPLQLPWLVPETGMHVADDQMARSYCCCDHGDGIRSYCWRCCCWCCCWSPWMNSSRPLWMPRGGCHCWMRIAGVVYGYYYCCLSLEDWGGDSRIGSIGITKDSTVTSALLMVWMACLVHGAAVGLHYCLYWYRLRGQYYSSRIVCVHYCEQIVETDFAPGYSSSVTSWIEEMD